MRPIVWVRDAATRSASAAEWLREPFVALDVETTLTDDRRLCLVQVGTPSANHLVDPLLVADLSPLAAVLRADGSSQRREGSGDRDQGSGGTPGW